MTTLNNDELFGRYASIEMKRHGVPNEHYQHKVIGRFRSNTWVDVPIQSPATPTIHDYSEDVVNVICCGVVEETVYRVRLSDVKLIPTSHDQQLLEAILEGIVDSPQYRDGGAVFTDNGEVKILSPSGIRNQRNEEIRQHIKSVFGKEGE